MPDTFDSPPPYPGVAFPAYPTWQPAPPPVAPPPPSRRWLPIAIGAGAALLAAAAFLLGRGTAGSSSRADGPYATALSALGAAKPVPANGPCGAALKRVAGGTLKSVSGSTLTLTSPAGSSVTVRTDGNTKVTKVVGATVGDVAVGAPVAVRGTTTSGSSTIAATQVDLLPADVTAQFPFLPGPGIVVPGGPAKPARGRLADGGLALGTVKSVSGSSFTVAAGSRTVTVTTSSATTFSKTIAASLDQLTLGQPVAVTGTVGSDGSISAATVAQGDANRALGGFPGFRFVVPGRGRFHGPELAPAISPPTTAPPATSPPTTG